MSSDTDIRGVLEKARLELLDLTTRNRLLNTRRTATRSGRLEIVRELSEEVFRILVSEKKALAFLPASESDEQEEPAEAETGLLAQPDDVFQHHDSVIHHNTD